MSTRIFLPGTRGRWVRRGGSIVLFPDEGGFAPRGGFEGEFETGGGPPPPPPATYTVCDFIHPNIDVAAQFALFGLLSGGPAARAAALSMLAHVRAGTLAGIFQEDQRVPALRARSLGSNWWTLIPPGAPAVCGVGTPPLIAFRRSLAKNRAALGAALLAVFPTCGLPLLAPPPPSGRSCTRPASVPSFGLIDVTPATYTWAAVTNSQPSTHSVTVRSRGPASVPFTASSDRPWLIPALQGVATPAGTPLRFIIDPRGLDPLLYLGVLSVSAGGSSIGVGVSLMVER